MQKSVTFALPSRKMYGNQRKNMVLNVLLLEERSANGWVRNQCNGVLFKGKQFLTFQKSFHTLMAIN